MNNAEKTRYNQKIQSCHQDFQIRKVSCEVRSKTEEKHGKFRTPEEACVISGKSRRLCAISGSSSQSRHSFRAWTRGIFGNGAFRGKSRSSPDFGKGVSRRAKSKFASKGHAFAHVLDRNRALRSAHSSLNRLTPSARACQRAKSKFASKGHASSSRTYLTETPRSARFSLNRLTPSARGCQRAAWEGEACSAAASHGRI